MRVALEHARRGVTGDRHHGEIDETVLDHARQCGVAQRVDGHVPRRDLCAFECALEHLEVVVYGFPVLAFVNTQG